MPREIHFFYDELWRGVLDEAAASASWGSVRESTGTSARRRGYEAFKELVQSGVDGLFLPQEIKRSEASY